MYYNETSEKLREIKSKHIASFFEELSPKLIKITNKMLKENIEKLTVCNFDDFDKINYSEEPIKIEAVQDGDYIKISLQSEPYKDGNTIYVKLLAIVDKKTLTPDLLYIDESFFLYALALGSFSCTATKHLWINFYMETESSIESKNEILTTFDIAE